MHMTINLVFIFLLSVQSIRRETRSQLIQKDVIIK